MDLAKPVVKITRKYNSSTFCKLQPPKTMYEKFILNFDSLKKNSRYILRDSITKIYSN